MSQQVVFSFSCPGRKSQGREDKVKQDTTVLLLRYRRLRIIVEVEGLTGAVFGTRQERRVQTVRIVRRVHLVAEFLGTWLTSLPGVSRRISTGIDAARELIEQHAEDLALGFS